MFYLHLHCVSKKNWTSKTGWYNFIKIGPLLTNFFQVMHWHLIAGLLCLKSLIWVECQLHSFHGNNSTMHERIYKKPIGDLNWVYEWLTSNWPGPITSGENDSNHVSRLRDSILNSCCNLYFRLAFIVCIDSSFVMTEKSKCNDLWRISISMLLWWTLRIQLSYNIVII